MRIRIIVREGNSNLRVTSFTTLMVVLMYVLDSIFRVLRTCLAADAPKILTARFRQVNCDMATYFEIEDHWVIPRSACASSFLAFLIVQITHFPIFEIMETMVLLL